jgi:glycosyltransferase involved in cell wall biosynthesis
MPSGIDFDAIARTVPASRRALGIAEDAEVVAFTGRFVPPKNIPLLAGALVRLLGARPRTVALACGDGPELPAFRATLDAAGLGARCHTLGYRADVWALLKAADVAIAPSLYEGRPNAVLEAAACDCPLVLSAIAPHRECLPDEGALWFSPRSPDDAAGALGRALDDRAAAHARARAARRAVDVHSPGAMARAYDRLYRALFAPGS